MFFDLVAFNKKNVIIIILLIVIVSVKFRSSSLALAAASWEELTLLFGQSNDILKAELNDYGVTKAPDKNKLILAWKLKLQRDEEMREAEKNKPAEAERRAKLAKFQDEVNAADRVRQLIVGSCDGIVTGATKSPVSITLSNIGYQNCGPTAPSVVKLTRPTQLVNVDTFHFWLKVSAPSIGASIGLRHVESDALYGPWPVTIVPYPAMQQKYGASPDYLSLHFLLEGLPGGWGNLVRIIF